MSRQVDVGPKLSEEEMTAVVIAIEMLISSPRVLEESHDVTPAWRFSGRWFERGQRRP